MDEKQAPPAPTRGFNVGEAVYVATQQSSVSPGEETNPDIAMREAVRMLHSLSHEEVRKRNPMIVDVYDDGREYLVEHDGPEGRTQTLLSWYSILPSKDGDSNLSTRPPRQYHNSMVDEKCIQETLDLLLYYGTAPAAYQRDTEWGPQDQARFLASVFEHRDLGSIVLRQLRQASPGYEVVDGKQRLTALIDFFLDRLMFCGLKFSQLSRRDQRTFLERTWTVTDLADTASEQDVLTAYLHANDLCPRATQAHLDKVRKMLKQPKDGTP